MAFAYLSGIITQTGTDTDLSGLNGLFNMANVIPTGATGSSAMKLVTHIENMVRHQDMIRK